ncbi:MAG: hypothetical protein COB04_12655 [Gammaproteobacteria bacterium]|nr:MAG: hypothetical protein COB04_12655 [Gammaproteobacteria bacterium]
MQKYKAHLLSPLLFITLLSFSANGLSQNYPEGDAASLGSASFRQADYTAALQYFQQAKSNAANPQEFDYNIAVCYAKLKQWPKANQAFTALYNQSPSDWWILYNLAITEKKLGHVDQATDYFLLIAEQREQPDLADYSQRQIQKIQKSEAELRAQELLRQNRIPASAPATSPQGSLWQGDLSLGVGNDNNIFLTASDGASSGTGDNFSDAQAFISWSSSEDLSTSWNFFTGVFATRYQEASNQDTSIASFGGRKYFPIRNARFYLGASIERILLESEPFQQNTEFQSGIKIPLRNKFRLNAEYRSRTLKSQDTQFDSQQGNRQRFDVGVRKTFSEKTSVNVRYRYDNDSREDDAFEGTFTSFSANRHSVNIRWQRLFNHWEYSLGADYRYSLYKQNNVDPEGNSTLRLDDRLILDANVTWLLNTKWALSIDYNYFDNVSTIDTFEESSQSFRTGIQRSF